MTRIFSEFQNFLSEFKNQNYFEIRIFSGFLSEFIFLYLSFGRSSIDGSPAMFSIGETDIEQQQQQQIHQQDPQQHFPIIRRHNSSQAQGTFGFLPVLPEALKTQNGSNINNTSISSNNSSTTISSESNETFNNNDIEMVTMNNKRFVATASEI